MSSKKPVVHEYVEVRDERQREEERYRIYSLLHDIGDLEAWGEKESRLRCLVAVPTLEGIGPTLQLLREEGQLGNDSRVGIKDDVERKWIINPYAKGDEA